MIWLLTPLLASAESPWEDTSEYICGRFTEGIEELCCFDEIDADGVYWLRSDANLYVRWNAAEVGDDVCSWSMLDSTYEVEVQGDTGIRELEEVTARWTCYYHPPQAPEVDTGFAFNVLEPLPLSGTPTRLTFTPAANLLTEERIRLQVQRNQQVSSTSEASFQVKSFSTIAPHWRSRRLLLELEDISFDDSALVAVIWDGPWVRSGPLLLLEEWNGGTAQNLVSQEVLRDWDDELCVDVLLWNLAGDTVASVEDLCIQDTGLTDEERDALEPPAFPDPTIGSCGCTAGGLAGAWWWAPVLLLAARRRRSRTSS